LLILDQNINDLADPTDVLPAGTIATCTFQIRNDAPLGTYALDGQRNRASDRVGNVLPSSVSDGAVTVTSPPCQGCC
jgi:hypothetical protein